MLPPGPDPAPVEVLVVGRAGVDLFPPSPGIPLAQVSTFTRLLGGSAANVAVAAARLGRRSALLSKVGPDGFGDYVLTALAGYGVDVSHVSRAAGQATPVTICALEEPEDPPLLFYATGLPPALHLTPDDVPWAVVDQVPVLWLSATGVAAEPARSTQFDMMRRRDRPAVRTGRMTVLDLDWRPSFWSSPREARAQYQRLLEVTSIAVGNRAEVEIAVGTRDPEIAAARLLDAGVQVAVVKLGAEGALVATVDSLDHVAPHRVEVVNGLGAGDAFGGALVHGLLSGWTPLQAVRYGTVAGAIVASRLACADAMPYPGDLDPICRDLAAEGYGEPGARRESGRRPAIVEEDS